MKKISLPFLRLQFEQVVLVLLPLVLCLCTNPAFSALNDWAEGSLSAADGATRDYYNRAAQLEWNNYLGDWRDANNIAQGVTPYDEVVVQQGEIPRFVDFNATSLVQSWVDGDFDNQGFFLRLMAGDSGPIDFNSREHVSTQFRPQLLITHGGQEHTYKPVADTYLESSTYRSPGDSDQLRLRRDGSHVLLRFDLRNIGRGVKIDSAILKLYATYQTHATTVTIGLLRSSHGEAIKNTPARKGLAEKYQFDEGIADHPDVLFSTGFEKTDWQSEWSNAGGFLETREKDAGLRFEKLRGKALRAKIPEGSNSSMSVTYKFMDKHGEEPEEIYFRYYLRFGDDWRQSVSGGKLPGISGTYGVAGWGGRKPDGTDGWSARGTYYLSIEGDNPLTGTHPIGTYCYYADQPGTYGDTWAWTKGYKGFLRKNKWYCVEQYLKMNTPGGHDGIIRAWVDGVPAFEKSDIMFRTVDRLKIEQIWMNVYHGGKAVSPYDQHLYVDNVVIARSYIGPMRGLSSGAFPWQLMLVPARDKR